MLVYKRIDISDGIDINKSYKSKECTLCHYWYFLDKNFSYGPYLCDGYMTQKCNKLKNIAIIHIKKSAYRLKDLKDFLKVQFVKKGTWK